MHDCTNDHQGATLGIQAKITQAPVVSTDPVLEAMARKLFGIQQCPPMEQAKMIKRAAKAGAEAAKKAQPPAYQGGSEGWYDEFKGKCVSCGYATPSSRKHEMNCHNDRAINRGLPCRGSGGGGSLSGLPVHRLFGCVYWSEPQL